MLLSSPDSCFVLLMRWNPVRINSLCVAWNDCVLVKEAKLPINTTAIKVSLPLERLLICRRTCREQLASVFDKKPSDFWSEDTMGGGKRCGDVTGVGIHRRKRPQPLRVQTRSAVIFIFLHLFSVPPWPRRRTECTAPTSSSSSPGFSRRWKWWRALPEPGCCIVTWRITSMLAWKPLSPSKVGLQRSRLCFSVHFAHVSKRPIECVSSFFFSQLLKNGKVRDVAAGGAVLC